MQVIYIAPLKAIVRERINDWRKGLVSQLGIKMVSICSYWFLINDIHKHVILIIVMICSYQVEMTGDYTPDLMSLLSANIIISTPEKWDGISRNWHSRSYVTKVHSYTCLQQLYSLNLCILDNKLYFLWYSFNICILLALINRLDLWYWMKFTYWELIGGPSLRYMSMNVWHIIVPLAPFSSFYFELLIKMHALILLETT